MRESCGICLSSNNLHLRWNKDHKKALPSCTRRASYSTKTYKNYSENCWDSALDTTFTSPARILRTYTLFSALMLGLL